MPACCTATKVKKSVSATKGKAAAEHWEPVVGDEIEIVAKHNKLYRKEGKIIHMFHPNRFTVRPKDGSMNDVQADELPGVSKGGLKLLKKGNHSG